MTRSARKRAIAWKQVSDRRISLAHKAKKTPMFTLDDLIEIWGKKTVLGK